MRAAVADENVPIVANDVVRVNSGKLPHAPQATNGCRLAVVRRLRELTSRGLVVIDDTGEIMRRYRRYLDGKGQPGLGDAFLKYVADHEYDERKVIRIALDRDENGNYRAFPRDPDLLTFDPADQIFVALAIASPQPTSILNAVDSDYAHHDVALSRLGVHVEELCREVLKPSTE